MESATDDDDDDLLAEEEAQQREDELFGTGEDDPFAEFTDGAAAVGAPSVPRRRPTPNEQARRAAAALGPPSASASAAYAQPAARHRLDDAYDHVTAVVRPGGARRRVSGSAAGAADAPPQAKRRRYGPLRSAREQARERRTQEDRRAGVHEPGYRCELCRLNLATRLNGPESDVLRKQYETLHRRLSMVAPDELYHVIVERFNAQLREFQQIGSSELRPWSVAAVRHHVEHCTPAYAGVMAAVRARDNLVDAQDHFFRTRCFYEEHPVVDEDEDGGGAAPDADDTDAVDPETGERMQQQDERAIAHYLRVQRDVRALSTHIQQQMHALQHVDFSSLHAISGGGRVKQEDRQQERAYRIGPLNIDAKAQRAGGRLGTAIMNTGGGGVR